MKAKKIILHIALTFAAVSPLAAQTVIPPSYAMPAGSVNTNSPGFRVRPYQTDTTHGGTLAWTEDQLAGLHGPNTADLSGADSNGYYNVTTVVNWNISAGGTVDGLPGADSFPGIGAGSTVNFSEEVLTYLELPTAGTYTMGVNSDDGFGVAAAALNPKDTSSAISLGKYDSTRGSGDTLFQFSVSQPGIYPFRLLYFQVGGGANVSWFSVATNSTSTNLTLINDLTSAGAVKAYASANIAPPYATAFVSSPAAFTFTIKDDLTALAPASLQVQLNGNAVTVTTSKTGSSTTVSYSPPVLFSAGQSNTVTAQFTDDAQPPHNLTALFTFIVPAYTAMPTNALLPASAVDTTQRGFLYRVRQIDSGVGVLAANIAHAEAQLAGRLIDPATGNPYTDTTVPGNQTGGGYVITNVNFSYDPSTAEEGAFTSANGHQDSTFPGLQGSDSFNMAGDIVAYLDLQPGFYTFAVNATDGFRLTAGANPYDAFGTTLGLFDYRAITTETTFGVAVQTAGIYPVRLVWFRMKTAADNHGDAGLELYTVNKDGSKTLVNDASSPNAVKAYWKRTADVGSFVKYAGPSSFVSPFGSSSDVGFSTVTVVISDGTTAKVDASKVALTVDGVLVATNATAANGLTTVSYTPTGLQLPRTVHAASLVYSDVGGVAHTNNWNFHLLRNYVLPTPVSFQDFESTAAGPDPTVPNGWVQENFTGKQDPGNDPANLNSDFYLGWVVVDKSFNIGKDFGVSAFAPQELNGTFFDEGTNALLVNHYIRAESDSRQNGPPGQIQYLTTESYDLTGKAGIVIAFDSSWEQNQDALGALEYTVDGGTSWNPILYWLQGGFDSQAPSDVIRDGLGNVDVSRTMLTSYSDVARYTDPTSGQLVGGYYGFFIKAPITQALAPYIEGRMNDDGSESKRIEVYRVPLADNQKSVKFRFVQAGTSSWYWAIDNWGIYSVPSLVTAPPQLGTVNVSLSNGKVVLSWTGAGSLQASPDFKTWTPVPNGGTSPVTISPTGQHEFYRLAQ